MCAWAIQQQLLARQHFNSFVAFVGLQTVSSTSLSGTFRALRWVVQTAAEATALGCSAATCIIVNAVRTMFVSAQQASVRALEQLFEELRQRTAQELAVLPKVGRLGRPSRLHTLTKLPAQLHVTVAWKKQLIRHISSSTINTLQARALIQAAQLQQRHLQQISSNLPQHLPSFQTGPQAAAAAQGVKPTGATAVSGVRGPAAATAEDAVKGEETSDAQPRLCASWCSCQPLRCGGQQRCS